MKDDARSKVTLRPRSKLERVVATLAAEYTIPDRPELDLLTQLTLMQLVARGAEARSALATLGPLCTKSGGVDAERLAEVPPDLVAGVCTTAPEETVRALRRIGEAALNAVSGLDAACQRDLAEARRLLRPLVALDDEPGSAAAEQRADHLLLQAGVHAIVAPTSAAVQVAARLGYPGTSYASLARVLDEELPDHDALEVAWTAHHALDQHGRTTCGANPQCTRCPVRAGCGYHGEGPDPATRIGGRTP